MSTSERKKFNTLIYEEASEWFIEFRSGEVQVVARRRFMTWLRTSPEHVRAYVELAAIWNEGIPLDPRRQIDESQIIEQALREANVISLELAPEARGSPFVETRQRSVTRAHDNAHSSTVMPRQRRRGTGILVAAALALAAVGVASWFHAERGVYSTEVGEQRSVTLPDGSAMNLNAKTRLRVAFSDHGRDIELLEGQALFQVAKDSARPFIVTSNKVRVRAVGTQFVVYRHDGGTTVSVIEGRVSVTEPFQQSSSNGQLAPAAPGNSALLARPPGEMLLSAGEQAVVSTEAALKSPKPNISAQTAWLQHSLVFESATLAEVAEEFNRYNHRRLVIRSPELYDFHITGTFSSTDPGSLLRFLQTRPGIIITQNSDEIQVSRQP